MTELRFEVSEVSPCGLTNPTQDATRAREIPFPVSAKRLPFFKVGKELKELVDQSRASGTILEDDDHDSDDDDDDHGHQSSAGTPGQP